MHVLYYKQEVSAQSGGRTKYAPLTSNGFAYPVARQTNISIR